MILYNNYDNNNENRSEGWDFHKSEEEGNTGFYFVRSNDKTIKLWKDAVQLAPR